MATRTYTADDLRGWRARAKLNQTQAAALFGTKQTTLSLWERGSLPRDFADRFEAALLAWLADKEHSRC
jgi:DNA-binding transcriptional regulator YiaG